MDGAELIRVVLDTNVIFEGLTKQHSACGIIVDAWAADLLKVYVSDAVIYEYVDVLSRKLSYHKWQKVQTTLATLLSKAEFTPIYYSWRPASPDPGDDLIIDCAMNANVVVITSNQKDFRAARKELGLRVLTPFELVLPLTQ
jgi:putative PIN family toxin of toxin-antitoxin system